MNALYLPFPASTTWPRAARETFVARVAATRASSAARWTTPVDGQTASHGRPPFELPSSWKENFQAVGPLATAAWRHLVVSFSEVALAPWTSRRATHRWNFRS